MKMKAFDEWITDRLPEHDGLYLVTTLNDINESKVGAASYIGGHWGTESKANRLTVTAWMALPEPYSESKHFLKEISAHMTESINEGLEGDDDDDVL